MPSGRTGRSSSSAHCSSASGTRSADASRAAVAALPAAGGWSILPTRARFRRADHEPVEEQEPQEQWISFALSSSSRSARTSTQVSVGDSVKVHYKIIEGTRERTQVFQGVVIRRHGASNRETFTVRKISFGVGVERTFPVHSPKIDKIEVLEPRQGPPQQALLPPRQGRQGRPSQGEGLLGQPSSRHAHATAATTHPSEARIAAPRSLRFWRHWRPCMTPRDELTVAEIRALLAERPRARARPRLLAELADDDRAGVRAACRAAQPGATRRSARAASAQPGLYALERAAARRRAAIVVAGVDEVGRGALAGPADRRSGRAAGRTAHRGTRRQQAPAPRLAEKSSRLVIRRARGRGRRRARLGRARSTRSA